MSFKYLIILTLDLVSKILTKLKLPGAKFYNSILHRYITRKLKPYFEKVYKYNKYKKTNKKKYKKKIIWIFWWQGLNNAPLIVKKCINSVINHSNGYTVILISKNNVKRYSTISHIIYDKLYEKNITFTHFSDILRFNLLDNYGGLWLDSTIYCTSDINFYGNMYTCGGYSDKLNFFVSNGRWTGFIIGGNPGNPLFIFMNEFFKLYWNNNNFMISYFLIDYALDYAYKKNIGGFKTYVNDKAYKNNPHLYALVNLLNDSYNLKVYQKITNDTNLFKLTYKKCFKDDGKTFYSKLIDN